MDGCGQCVWWVLVFCGFFISLVGVGGDKLVGGVLLLMDDRVPCLALLDTQLCLGYILVG